MFWLVGLESLILLAQCTLSAKPGIYLALLQRSLSANFQITSDSLDVLNLKVKIEHVLNTLEQSTHRKLIVPQF